jgi:hypothetical protein
MTLLGYVTRGVTKTYLGVRSKRTPDRDAS